MKIAKTAGLIASTGLVMALGLAAGSAVGGANEGPPPAPSSEETDPSHVLTVTDRNGPVGKITLGELLAPPSVVDGETRQAFYPNPGWPIENDAGAFVGYYVPEYGFMTPEEAASFQANPSEFDSWLQPPLPEGTELPEGFDPLPGPQQ